MSAPTSSSRETSALMAIASPPRPRMPSTTAVHGRVIGVAIDHDLCTEGRETLGNNTADLLARAGDDGNLAVEPEAAPGDHEPSPVLLCAAYGRSKLRRQSHDQVPEPLVCGIAIVRRMPQQ